jgi:hypothetical protein
MSQSVQKRQIDGKGGSNRPSRVHRVFGSLYMVEMKDFVFEVILKAESLYVEI